MSAQERESSWITSMKDNVISGAVAGVPTRVATSPFDVIKIRYQLQQKAKYTSLFQSFSTVIKEEGVLGLWKGNLSATCLYVSYNMVQFGVHGLLKGTLDAIPDPLLLIRRITTRTNSFGSSHEAEGEGDASHPPTPVWKQITSFLAGAGAGIAATVATYPFDIMRTQFAIQGKEKNFTSMYSFIAHTIKTKGVKGFFSGLTPAIVGIGPYMGLIFPIYETVKAFSESPIFRLIPKQTLVEPSSSSPSPLTKNSQFGDVVNFVANYCRKGLCGAIAGGTAKFIVYPLDTLKKRMQVQVLKSTLDGLGSMPKYRNVFHCITKTFAEEGIVGFYKGIIPTIAKSGVQTAITFATFEGTKDWLSALRQSAQSPKP